MVHIDSANILASGNSNGVNLEIKNADEEITKKVREIFASDRLQELIKKVADAYRSKKVTLKMDPTLDFLHGAFDPEQATPTILFNPKTGISESNFAHELIHALQIRQGYPTVPKFKGFNDKRGAVLRELCSNIMHISLADTMLRMGFSLEEYLRPTLEGICKVLSNRRDDSETKMIFLRSHYEASVYLRLHFEAKFLSKKQKQTFESLFERKAPIAKSIGKELIKIIEKCDTHSPDGAITALYICVKFLNIKDLSKYYSDYAPNAYETYLQYWLEKYLILQNIK